MSKKIKLEFTAQQLHLFNQVWQVKKPLLIAPEEKDIDRMITLLSRKLAIRFLKKGVEARLQKNTITLEEFEALALKLYLDAFLDWLELQDHHDVYFDNLVRKQFRILDQKTV